MIDLTLIIAKDIPPEQVVTRFGLEEGTYRAGPFWPRNKWLIRASFDEKGESAFEVGHFIDAIYEMKSLLIMVGIDTRNTGKIRIVGQRSR